MGIPKGMYEFSRLKPRDLSNHRGQESIGSDIEGDAEENIGASLVELARKPSIRDIELEEGVAWGQGHIL